MNKNKVRLTESQLHRVIKESVKKVLNETSRDIDDDTYYGGGLPDSYSEDNNVSTSTAERYINKVMDKIEPYLNEIYETVQDYYCDNHEDDELSNLIDEFCEKMRSYGKCFYRTDVF